jgi:hypothetical protein
MVTMKAMTITIDSLLPRPKLDCDVGYDVAVKGASVVVSVQGVPSTQEEVADNSGTSPLLLTPYTKTS